MIPEEILNRKGARKPAEVPAEVLTLLNQGKIPTVNLSEWLAIDQKILFENFTGEVKLDKNARQVVQGFFEQEPDASNNTLMRFIGQTLEEQLNDPDTTRDYMNNSKSDVMRCWAAHMVGKKTILIKQKLDLIRPYAADDHFGVREVAFMSVKPDIAQNVEATITHLKPWTSDADDNVRRFVIEATRPIGVWTNKIDALKTNPEKAIDLLQPLSSDPSKYVRDSVANWLNDASKTRPEWVQEVCDNWSSESDTKETAYIIKRALRTINKST